MNESTRINTKCHRWRFFNHRKLKSDSMLDFMLYLLGCLLFLVVTEKYRRATFGMAVLLAVSYPLAAEISQFSLFIQIKYYSVIIPTVLFSFSKCKPHFTDERFDKVFAILPGIIRFTLAVNIAEAAVYVAMFDKFVTAFFGFILVITVPKFSYDEHQNIGFEDPWWAIAYSSCLTIGLSFHPVESLLTLSGIAILAIALLSCVYVKDWSKWITFRIYSLYYLVVLDAFFSRNGLSIYDRFDSSSFSPENRNVPGLENLFRIVSIALCMVLVYRWLKLRNAPPPLAT